MWLSPRVTIRRILESEARPSWTTVVALATVGTAISSLQVDEARALSASRSAMPVALSALQLIFGVLVGPFILAIVGGWLGGDADAADLREAVAWSYVPIATTSPLWIPVWFTLGSGALAKDVESLVGSEWLGMALLAAIVLINLWSVPLLIGGLSAAQRFSIGKTIVCVAITLIPLVVLRVIS